MLRVIKLPSKPPRRFIWQQLQLSASPSLLAFTILLLLVRHLKPLFQPPFTNEELPSLQHCLPLPSIVLLLVHVLQPHSRSFPFQSWHIRK